jgi:hypothetical protein
MNLIRIMGKFQILDCIINPFLLKIQFFALHNNAISLIQQIQMLSIMSM